MEHNDLNLLKRFYTKLMGKLPSVEDWDLRSLVRNMYIETLEDEILNKKDPHE